MLGRTVGTYTADCEIHFVAPVARRQFEIWQFVRFFETGYCAAAAALKVGVMMCLSRLGGTVACDPVAHRYAVSKPGIHEPVQNPVNRHAVHAAGCRKSRFDLRVRKRALGTQEHRKHHDAWSCEPCARCA